MPIDQAAYEKYQNLPTSQLRALIDANILAMPEDAQNTMAREYALLTAQFALVKGFLIGVAGFHREEFSAEYVAHTVQATSKHFEHHPEFHDLAYQLLAESQMDGARGLAILLRNAEPKPLRPAVPGIHAPEPREERFAPFGPHS